MLSGLRLRKLRIREQEKLDEFSLGMFKKVTEYIKNSNLTYFEKEEVLQQIMDIILQLQADHKSLDPIFDDYEIFCNSIIKEYTSDKTLVYTVLHYIQRLTINMLCLIAPVVIFIEVFFPNANKTINMHSLFFAFGAAIFIWPLVHKNKKTRLFLFIYLFFILLVDGNIQKTNLGIIIENSLVNNENFVILTLLIIAVLIELYKRIYDRIHNCS